MEAALKTFFTSSRFAVVGASSDPTKFGHKGEHNLETGLLQWDQNANSTS
jgi:hypothetical protein